MKLLNPNACRLGMSVLMATFSTGCALNREVVITEPVGPQPQTSHVPSPSGNLVVYSGFETTDATGFQYEYVQPHTAYDICTPDGRLLQHVRNYGGGFLDNPESVTLPAGNYRISAQANGYYRVLLTVVVVTGRTTFVHLDSSGFDLAKQSSKGKLVTLPDGQIVGWLANGSSDSNLKP